MATIYTVIRTYVADGSEDGAPTLFGRAFYTREEAVHVAQEDAIEMWDEVTGGNAECPGLSPAEEGMLSLELAPETRFLYRFHTLELE